MMIIVVFNIVIWSRKRMGFLRRMLRRKRIMRLFLLEVVSCDEGVRGG